LPILTIFAPICEQAATNLTIFDRMEELEQRTQRPPWLSVSMILIVTLMGFMIVGPLIGFFLAWPFSGYSLLEFVERLTNPIGDPGMKIPQFIVQAGATFIGLLVVPYLYAVRTEKINAKDLFKGNITALTLLITLGIVIFFMGFNSVIIEWNAKISFPEFMKGFETWARRTEDLGAAITKYLTQFDSIGQFIIALTVIAVFGGIAEEFVFRGLLQPALHRATGNIHAAIWIAAILFSALHMQFFGFVPRMLLGALFGYLYYWSGNLAVSMFAHFVNNASSVIAIYLVQLKVTDIDMETPEAMPWPTVIIFTLLTGALLFYFKKQSEASNSSRA